MVLVDREIREECEKNRLIEPFVEENLNPASIDVCIGNTVKIERLDPYTLKPQWVDLDISGYSRETPFLVEPKEFLLVGTREVFNLPEYLTGEFRLKSSRAREGWNNCLAVWLDPCWQGSVLTMELINECRYHSLPLYPGLRIGQAIFHRCSPPDKHYGLTGRYNGDRTVMGSKG